jgi:glycosyltransferase involved in cell wall biosynthesis
MVAQLARELDQHGHFVVVFVPPRGDGWIADQLAGSGVAIDHFWLARPFDPGCARELAGSLRSHHVDIAHSHEFSLAFYGAWAARLSTIPHIITIHGRGHYSTAMRRRLALRTAATASAATVTVSQALGAQLARDLFLPRRRIAFIPNGVGFSPAVQSTLRSELQIGTRPLVVSVGSLYPVKGHRYLIEAAARLSSKYPELQVAIAGRGQLRDELLELARSLGLQARIHLLGLRTDIANVLAAADVFALPSLAEGLPLALLEAMLAELPIVASNVGEVGSVLAHGGAGLLVRPSDSGGLATSLDQLLSDPAAARQMAERAARRANADYRIERMTARYEALYRAVIGHQSPASGQPLAAAASPS